MKLAILTLALALLAVFTPEVPQPQSYHAFADARMLLGIPNFWNVVSNLPFLLVGAAGLVALLPPAKARAHFRDSNERWPYVAFFAALVLTAAGSSYYHLAPDDARLVWDRLPIALLSAALGVALIGDHDRPDSRLPLLALGPALIAGAISVWYWQATEAAGAGNLVPYLTVQIWAAAVMVLLLVTEPARYSHRNDLWLVLVFWVLARAAEFLDTALYAGGLFLSGHTLKHLLAALAAAWLLRMIRRRTPLATVVSTSAPIAA
jgi:hypothetical protein